MSRSYATSNIAISCGLQLQISPPCGNLGFFGLWCLRENLYLVHSFSECICTRSFTWGAPECTGSYFRCQLITRSVSRSYETSNTAIFRGLQLRISPPCGNLGFFGLWCLRENLYLVHSVSKCICTGSLTWGAPKCTGSHFRSTDNLRIPTWALLPITFDYALLQPTPLSSLNADFLSQLHLAFE